MSAYIVSQNVIDTIVNLIAGNGDKQTGNSDIERYFGNRRIATLLGAAQLDGLVESQEFPCPLRLEMGEWLDSERSEFLDLLGRVLWSMNVNAVSQRYRDCVHATSVDQNGMCTDTGKPQLPGPVPNPNPHDYVFRAIPISKKAAIADSYCEFNYQCCEGNVPDTNLYKQLESMVGEMAIMMITEQHRLQETQNAESSWQSVT